MSRTALPAGIVVIALATTRCGGNDGPTAPAASAVVLTNARVVVGGEIVNGLTLPRAHGEAGSTRFEASLLRDGRPAPGQVVRVQFDRPTNSGMMNTGGMFSLYDDGTHGDPMPGDGIYCYEDISGQYGCHSENAAPGQYHYDFWGMHDGMHESNHVMVTVTINP
ncbi:MAG TPA: choice-of-anchor X domain-containing protein [Thermoanaerobaculia bacterium]|nr:choice-of-anchor X domain-containing protein [Thermoanaerobaculia bacterium]